MEPTRDQVARHPDQIVGVMFVAAYVDDLANAVAFYTELLGLEKQSDMGNSACYLKAGGGVGLYLEGGHPPTTIDAHSARTSFGLTSTSVDATFRRLRDAGVNIIHASGPQDMGDGQAWFQCHDPAGNIIEIVGHK